MDLPALCTIRSCLFYPHVCAPFAYPHAAYSNAHQEPALFLAARLPVSLPIPQTTRFILHWTHVWRRGSMKETHCARSPLRSRLQLEPTHDTAWYRALQSSHRNLCAALRGHPSAVHDDAAA